MKIFFTLFFCSVFIFTTWGQNIAVESSKPDPVKNIQLVDAACGQCKLGLPGKSCDLAVRINGKSYFVDGTNIDSHGDAHAKDGFCEAIRKAEVQGEIVNNRFQSTYFQLVSQPVEKTQK